MAIKGGLAGRSVRSCLKDGHSKSAESSAVLASRRVKSCRQDGSSRQDSEVVWLKVEARLAIRMKLQGQQDV